MNTINNNLNSYNLYTQSNSQVSNSQDQPRVHHHNKKVQSQDSCQFTQEGLQASITAHKSPLDSLVANGTLTQDQENSIMNAFQSAKQANMSGSYVSKPTDPISNLIDNGTITQEQSNAIKSAFQSIAQANQGNQQVSDSEGQARVHHKHHHGQQSQSIIESSQTTSESSSN